MVSFDSIRDAYARRRRKLLMSGRFQRPTAAGYWATSNPDHVLELFQRLELARFSGFVDLGSGDGIVTAVASLFTDASGIEIDRELHEAASSMSDALSLKCKFYNDDYLQMDLSSFDVVFINPDNYFHRLERKLLESFRGTVIIADNIFRPLTLKPEKEINVRGTGYSIYRVL